MTAAAINYQAMLPSFSGWQRVKKSDPMAVTIANRHYSRILFGKQGKMLGPPGRLLCYRIEDYAVWVSHWPYADLALDGMDAYRCTIFRNERRERTSSVLIQQAMRLTEEEWGRAPHWITWVAPEPIASVNPGYCFKVAGWKTDKGWVGSRKTVKLKRLWAPSVDDLEPVQ